MTEQVSDPTPQAAGRLTVADRIRAALGAAWALVLGAAPHVLHHVGPLAGAAVLAGATGRLVFGIAGLLLAIPLLRRIYRHTGTLVAPALALAAMTTAFLVSSFVIAPALTGTSSNAGREPSPTMPGHEAHHSGQDN